MNLLKSIYVSTYMMVAMFIMGYAIWSLVQTGNYVSWGGVLLATAPFMIVLTWIMATKSVARTSAHFPLLNILGMAGVALSAWGYFANGAGTTALMLAIVGWLGFIVYSYWYSVFGRKESEQLQAGRKLPEFQVMDTSGNMVGPASFSGQPTVWMFYRGNWCPLCMAQIKELVKEYQSLEELGARVALVSPQPHKYTISLARKFGVKFDFLADENNQAAKVLGIFSPNGLPMGLQALGYDNDTVLPTVIITDKDGSVLWAHETDNYRVRPEPSVYLGVLRDHKAH